MIINQHSIIRRVLVTGPTSFIGASLCKSLTRLGVDVHVMVRKTSDRSRLESSISASNIHVIDGTIRCLSEIVSSVKPDVVYHLAGLYHRLPETDRVDDMVVANVQFGTQLLEAIRMSPIVPRIVCAGSYVEYYKGEQPRPLNLYAATKQAFSQVLNYYSDAESFITTTLVLFDLYGPGEWRQKLVSAIIEAQKAGKVLALPEYDAMMDLVHIDDAVSAFVKAGELTIQSPNIVRGNSFFVSNPHRHSISEVIKLCEEIKGTPVLADWGTYKLPDRKIMAPVVGPPLPGWALQISLSQGLSELIEQDN